MVYEKSLVRGKNNQFNCICLPLNIAPYSIYIVPKFNDKEKTNQSIAAYQLLLEKGVPVLYDDRTEVTIGAKIKDSKITGTPYVAVFGRTLEQGFVEVENNLTGEKTNMTMDEFITNFVEFESYRKYNVPLEEVLKNKSQ